ncbi:hypothetical protein HUB98_08025 [Paenibacillus barcinonensis]|uniref:Dolichyl-phosphate-mannose-protein mannosyltransferase n=1 Tax=Paenibacillus barcinonensis TaxID=198119 RepID=A0A2V4UZV3_PAEBA|nr:DUF6080 domain-containing protein [Paenibacillus barcinonensis]PYE45717.1 hypothetical protein DFQ00_11764 [Paenibacillus barcinonensis]QKS56291.1 hypothetical protein HUB98_08025 [Paenibacillus barcinonensis]
MKFLDYIWYDRRVTLTAFYLFAGFALFYGVMNGSYVIYMSEHADMLAKYTPFNTTLFPLNLFNFDPSMYYGDNSSSVIHPLISYLAVTLAAVSKLLGGNWFFLILQSLVNAGSVILVYIFLSRNEERASYTPLLFALLFGFSSYLMYTALIPDSYPYVQFVILLSVVYLQYTRVQQEVHYVPNALLATINFGLTSTNIVPFAGAVFFNMKAWRTKAGWKKYVGIMALAVLMIVVLTAIQYVAFGGRSWVSNWLLGIQNGGTSYATPFQWAVHVKALTLLTINPMLSPKVHLLDPGMVAFVTDLSRANPLYVQMTGGFLLLLAFAGFIRRIRESSVWTLMPYIIFAFLLHLVVGFGLAVYQYDMYLYAGHYLFAFYLLGGMFISDLRSGLGKKVLTGLLIAALLVTVGNNIYRHVETLSTIKQAYTQLEEQRSIKQK